MRCHPRCWRRRGRGPSPLVPASTVHRELNKHMGLSLKMVSTPKPNGFADHYPYEKWLFHWEYTLFSDKPIWRLTHQKCRKNKQNHTQKIEIDGVSRVKLIYFFEHRVIFRVIAPCWTMLDLSAWQMTRGQPA